MENRLFMDQTVNKRREKITAVIKARTSHQLTNEQVSEIVRCLPLHKQFLITTLPLGSSWLESSLKLRKAFPDGNLWLHGGRTENNTIVFGMELEDSILLFMTDTKE